MSLAINLVNSEVTHVPVFMIKFRLKYRPERKLKFCKVCRKYALLPQLNIESQSFSCSEVRLADHMQSLLAKRYQTSESNALEYIKINYQSQLYQTIQW